MSFVVREARADELAAVGALTAEGYLVDDLLRRPDGGEEHYQEHLRDAAGRARDAIVLVAADDDGGLLGTVTWCPVGSALRELATIDDQAEFRMLSVSAAARRRGVGRALVQACLDRAKDGRMREVVICSMPQMHNAHALYRSFGFVRNPQLDWSPAPSVELWGFRLTMDHPAGHQHSC